MDRARQSVTHVPVDLLIEHPSNVRDDLPGVSEIAASIKQHGILQPLTATDDPGYPGRLLLLAGHRRLAGARLVGLKVVPVIIRHGVVDPEQQLVLMLVENTQRRDLEPMERAEAYGALQNRGLSIADISRRTGIGVSTISNYLNLLLLSPDEQDRVRSGELSPFQAISALRRERQDSRRLAGEPRLGRPRKAPQHGGWFGPSHRLADLVRQRCDHPSTSSSIHDADVGCGPCWEAVILEDAVRMLNSGRG
jgi:ParB family chromosome partitioning protein